MLFGNFKGIGFEVIKKGEFVLGRALVSSLYKLEWIVEECCYGL
jgi:hypothetical protein